MSKLHPSNLIHLLFVLLKMYKSLRHQQSFLNLEFKSLFDEVKNNNDGTVKADDFFKMTRYYGYAVPAVLGEGICLLRGKEMTDEERKISTCQGIITGIYDDFIDKNSLSPENIKKITREPKSFPTSTLINKIFVENWSCVLDHIHNDKLLWKMVEKIYHVQIETKKQYEEDLSFDEIKKITYDKGGYSVLFYRSVYTNELVENEYEAFYKLGALLQFGNDIFDLRDDMREGVYTMITKSKHLDRVSEEFYKLKNEMILCFHSLSYGKKNVQKFLRYVMLIVNRCEVCLNQLCYLEKKTGEFVPQNHTRQEIVCDMEKRGNFFKTLKYYLRTEIKKTPDI